MLIYESILLNTIYMLLPLFIYLFFVAYDKSLNKDENNLILDICLISSVYLLIKFGTSMSVLLVSIPLIISYYHKKHMAFIVISIFNVIYESQNNDINFYLVMFEYLVYYLIFVIFIFKKYKDRLFVFLIAFLNSVLYIINYNDVIPFRTQITEIFIFILMIYLVLSFLKKASKIMKYHMILKEFEQEKQIRDSLFKITHEIKNPLAVCKGYLDMFDVDNQDHAKRYVPILKEEIEKTLILLKDFLSFTKIKIDKELLDINFLLEEVTDSLKPLFKEKGIDLKLKILDEEIYIEGDYNRLCQVMTNIIKNAVEAMEDTKGPEIKIYSRVKNNEIKINVIDNGVGLDENELTKISVPFFTTKKDGTGLGVSMSLEIIKSHSGSMTFISKKNNGTKVEITLPVIYNYAQ